MGRDHEPYGRQPPLERPGEPQPDDNPPPPGPVGRRSALRWAAAGAVLAAVGGEEVLRRTLHDRSATAAATPLRPSTAHPHDHPHDHPGTAPGAASGTSAAPPPPVDEQGRRWSDPAGWEGGVPGPRDTVRIRDRVVLDTDAAVAGLVVDAGGSLVYSPTRTVTLSSTGSVVVRGTLALAPADPGTAHTLRFTGIDEKRFQGGGMGVVEGDTGLWVTGDGYLRLDGAAKTAWVRAAASLRPGDRTVTLTAAPDGWQTGDRIAVTPTAPPDSDGFSTQYDLHTVRSVSGRTITLDGPLRYPHPRVAAGGGVTVGAEVLNLSRNVRVEGTPGGRAHIHLTSSRRQDVRHAALRWLGPRSATDETWTSPQGPTPVTAPVLGRYALHFHMVGDASRGTTVEGVVIRDAGNHAFVPHGSHGITFRSCISHDTWEDAYWWDGAPDTRTPQGPSDEIVYDSCVASRTRLEPNFRAYRLTGFSLGAGRGSTARDCVAVGVQGAEGASGYEWPEGGEGVWTFERCLAHNNLEDGIFVWLNTSRHHVISDFVAYHNGGWGIEHGAYLNDFTYRSSVLHGNASGGIAVHSLGAGQGTLFDGMLVDAAGMSDFAVSTARHELDGDPVTLSRCRFTGYRKAGVAFRATHQGAPDNVEVLDCAFDGNQLWLDPEAPEPRTVVFREAGSGGAVTVLARGSGGKDGGGREVPAWNAATRPATVRTAARTPLTPAIRLGGSAAPTARLKT
ncbi:right-handed parallel beta-helix repeat-containing protein [Peterkaempfera bronchialis]|uniref:right-handed parallel beta-helix repeat-containing protein n=1 Tax=Peterkaempfera bronchialis TaxID=2126346 RepID=UPI003C30D486